MSQKKHTVNAEVHTKKAETKTKAETKGTETQEEKKSVFKIVASPFVGAFHVLKGLGTKAWDSIKARWNSEVADFRALGVTKYLMDRLSKSSFAILKMAGAATALYFIDMALMKLTGISLLDPTVLVGIAIAGIVLAIVYSVTSQKESGAEVSAENVGYDLMGRLVA